MRRYQDAVFNMLYRMTGNQDLAFDLVQETFLKAYRSIDTFRHGARFYTWVYRIAVNSLRSHWRKQGRLPTEQSLDEDPGEYIAPSTSNNPGKSPGASPSAKSGSTRRATERANDSRLPNAPGSCIDNEAIRTLAGRNPGRFFKTVDFPVRRRP